MFKIKRSHLRIVLAVGVCVALMVPPATASAQDALSNPTASQYHPQSQVQGTSTNGSAANNSAASPAATATNGASGILPFTGMDLAMVAGVALTMVAAGLALRRLSAPRTPGV